MVINDYNMNDYMSFESNVDPPANYIPREWNFRFPNFNFQLPPNLLGMAQAAAQAAAQQAAQAAMMQGMAKAAEAAQALAANIPPISLPGPLNSAMSTASGIKAWFDSGRFDFPHGGDIDFFHNRICFGKVCKHDPEMTGDVGTEWLRRSVPIAPYKPGPPKAQPMLLIVPRPLQKYSLVPYENVTKGRITCASRVKLPNGVGLEISPVAAGEILDKKSGLGSVKLSAVGFNPGFISPGAPRSIKNFL